jgi:glycosyltransferase involved in cell wall biosynthesis
MGLLRDRIDGVEVLRYPQRAANGLAGYLLEYLPSMLFTALWVLWVRRRGPIRIIHGCNPPDLFWVFGRLLRRGSGAYVFDQHDANPELSLTKWGGRNLRGRLLFQVTLALERASYRTAALVIAPNESYRQLAIDRGGLPPERIVLVRNAPDLARYKALTTGIEPVGRQIGYVGVMGSQDGLDLLLDAWRIVVDQPGLADARLQLIGDGEARNRLEQQTARLHLSESVRFWGYQASDVFVPIIARCLAGVSPDPPTPFNDVSTMVKVVDYLAIGRPVVGFDLRQTRLLAADAARLSPRPTAEGLADALIEILRSPTLAHKLGTRAAERIAALELDWKRSEERLVEAYASLA